jgi:hypothetical protein
MHRLTLDTQRKLDAKREARFELANWWKNQAFGKIELGLKAT